MAEFTVQETEGVRNIKLDIRDETVRAARGALSHMHGAIQFTPRLPNAADLLRTVMTEEVCIRPYFTGSGTMRKEYLHTESGRLGRAACPRWETVPPAQ